MILTCSPPPLLPYQGLASEAQGLALPGDSGTQSEGGLFITGACPNQGSTQL